MYLQFLSDIKYFSMIKLKYSALVHFSLFCLEYMIKKSFMEQRLLSPPTSDADIIHIFLVFSGNMLKGSVRKVHGILMQSHFIVMCPETFHIYTPHSYVFVIGCKQKKKKKRNKPKSLGIF